MIPHGMRQLIAVLPQLSAVALAAQPSAPAPIEAPLRELPWGQLNFLHTTDVHGWFGGHLQEASYAADWGDYISFSKHLRARADADGSDLLVIDTGDRIEGNGLYDASDPKGQYVFDIVKEQEIDLMCTGNHELYKSNSSEGEFNYTVPNFKDNYLASNLDIRNPESGKFEPLARRYKTFTTKNQGIRVLAFGFIFDFKGNSNNTIVHKVEDTVKEEWFTKALKESQVDLIIIAGHVPVRSPEYDALFKAIRNVNWDIPIQFFGGHTHIRDFKVYDSKATAFESGRYMETIGFLSINGLNGGGKRVDASVKTPKFSRVYIDNNLFSLHHHSGKDNVTFGTSSGNNASQMIFEARKSLKLDETYGCAPQDYWVNRAPYPHDQSIFTWLEKFVFPDQFSKSQRAIAGHPALIISNTGAMRFDIFKGPFTRDTTFLVSPFTSGWGYIKDVPYAKAKQLLTLLNNEGPMQFDSATLAGLRHTHLGPAQQLDGKSIVAETEQRWHHDVPGQVHMGISDDSEPTLIPGYTTHDDLGDDGDDTIHSKIPFFDVPNCIQAPVLFNTSTSSFDGSAAEPETVDVVYNEFVQGYILLALEYLGQNYEEKDTGIYLNGTLTSVITDWVKEHWGGKHCT